MLITGTAVANPPLKRIRHTHSTTMSEAAAAAASLKAWKIFVITHHRETRGFLPHSLSSTLPPTNLQLPRTK